MANWYIRSGLTASLLALAPVVAMSESPRKAPSVKSHAPAPGPTAPATSTPSPAATPAPRWSDTEVAAERNRCAAMLKAIQAVAVPMPTVSDGSCGAVAPVQLISVGRNPEVVLSPPATLTCDMVVALHSWVTEELQPAARKHLKGAVVRIDTMSSYSCRTAYGRRMARLSEHGHANAIDIRSFLTDRGHSVDLLADWGPTGRDIAAQIAAAKAAETRRIATAKAAGEKAAPPPAGGAAPTPALGATASVPRKGPEAVPSAEAPPARTGFVLSGPPALRGTLNLPAIVGGGPSASTSLGVAPPSRLGGPKAAVAPDASHKAMFLRQLHAAACRIFGTTLGPESNEAHRNHFHLDMAQRRTGNFCE